MKQVRWYLFTGFQVNSFWKELSRQWMMLEADFIVVNDCQKNSNKWFKMAYGHFRKNERWGDKKSKKNDEAKLASDYKYTYLLCS